MSDDVLDLAARRRQLRPIDAGGGAGHDRRSPTEATMTWDDAELVGADPHSREFAHVSACLVPRRGVPVERWTRAPGDSRLRFVTRLEVRYVEPPPPGWGTMPPQWLERMWEGAEPA